MTTFKDYKINVPDSFSGEKYVLCPECSHTRKKKNDKCLSVNGDKGTWYCHHCNWKGGLKNNTSNVYKPPVKKYKKPQPKKRIDLSQNAIDWFADRKISKETLERNKIGFENGWILFPYYRNKELINIKYRNRKKEFRMEKDCERMFYGLDDTDNAEELIVCEGECDKLALEEAGFINAISVPNGAPAINTKNYDRLFGFLESAADIFINTKKVILATDNDEPGMKLREELSRRIGKEKCYTVLWAENCKDANDVLVKHDKLTLEKCIKNASPYPVNGIFEVKDIFGQIDLLYQEGYKRGEYPGWSNLGELYTVRPGEWTVVSGIPSHGKSSFLDNILVNLTNKGWNIAIYSPENQPLARHAAKLIEIVSRIPFFDGPRQRIQKHELEIAKEYLQKYFTFILPEDESHTIQHILSLAKTLVLRKGIKGLVIDPWNELDHSRPAGLTETEYISQSLSVIRRFARSYGVHVWLVAHPTKLKKDESGNYPVPTPYDIAGSAHFRNKADNALCVWRDLFNDNTPVQVHVQKIRFKEIGRIGVVGFSYDVATGVYKETNIET